MFSTDLPLPILFHPLKHHIGFIKTFINKHTETTPAQIRDYLATLGTSQLDLYLGPLAPQAIAQETIEFLEQQKLSDATSFRNFLVKGGADYHCITLSDQSDWVLRWGVIEGRFVHLHPARYSSYTIRVKAASLKTAIATAIIAIRYNLPPHDLSTINTVRKACLNMPPVKHINVHEGIGKFLNLLCPN